MDPIHSFNVCHVGRFPAVALTCAEGIKDTGDASGWKGPLRLIESGGDRQLALGLTAPGSSALRSSTVNRGLTFEIFLGGADEDLIFSNGHDARRFQEGKWLGSSLGPGGADRKISRLKVSEARFHLYADLILWGGTGGSARGPGRWH